MLGVFCLTPLGLHGGLLQMINHGLATGGLFAVVGMLYERYHTRKIEAFGGLARKLPVLAFMTFVLTFSSIGLPGLNGFAGEILVLIAMFQRAWMHGGGEMVLAVLATSGVVLGAWYMLTLVGRLFFGPLVEPLAEAVAERDGCFRSKPESDEDWMSYHVSTGRHEVRDLSLREVFALSPLLVFIVWIGIQPNYFLQRMTPALRQIERSITLAEGTAAGLDQATTPDTATVDPLSRVFVGHFRETDETTNRLSFTDKADAPSISVTDHD
jgi:NADH-quinone oxidoreductase subunit M